MNKTKLSIFMLCSALCFNSNARGFLTEAEQVIANEIYPSAETSQDLVSRIKELKSKEAVLTALGQIAGTQNSDKILSFLKNLVDQKKMTPAQQELIDIVFTVCGTHDPRTVNRIFKELQNSQKDIQNKQQDSTKAQQELDMLRIENLRLNRALTNSAKENSNLRDENDRLKRQARNYVSQSDLNSCEAKVTEMKRLINEMVRGINRVS